MLINSLMDIFKKYIYNPHVHDYKYDRTVAVINVAYKCACGKIKIVAAGEEV